MERESLVTRTIMTTYRLIEKADPAFITMRFDFYNEAVGFAKAFPLLQPSKPFKRGADWFVTMKSPAPKKAKYLKLPDWKKPTSYYDYWENCPGLEGIPECGGDVSEAMIGDMVHKAQQRQMVNMDYKPLPKKVYEDAANGWKPLPLTVYEQAHRVAYH